MESGYRDDIVIRLGKGEDSSVGVPCLFDSILILSICPAMSCGVDCDDFAAAGLVLTRLGDEVGESDMRSECSVFRFDNLWDVCHTYPLFVGLMELGPAFVLFFRGKQAFRLGR